MKVPEHLYGPLKFASPTINIEQIMIPEKHILHYEKTGEKNVSLVTGSCASITISAITIKFVEDMIEKFKNNYDLSIATHKLFRKEYNLRILTYLCGKGISPKINWFNPENFKEENIYNVKSDMCMLLDKNDLIPIIYNEDNVVKILESIDKNISNKSLQEEDIKEMFNTMKTSVSCENYDKTKCNLNDECVWQDGCYKNICKNATNEECDKLASKCYYDTYTKKCKPKPS